MSLKFIATFQRCDQPIVAQQAISYTGAPPAGAAWGYLVSANMVTHYRWGGGGGKAGASVNDLLPLFQLAGGGGVVDPPRANIAATLRNVSASNDTCGENSHKLLLKYMGGRGSDTTPLAWGTLSFQGALGSQVPNTTSGASVVSRGFGIGHNVITAPSEGPRRQHLQLLGLEEQCRRPGGGYYPFTVSFKSWIYPTPSDRPSVGESKMEPILGFGVRADHLGTTGGADTYPANSPGSWLGTSNIPNALFHQFGSLSNIVTFRISPGDAIDNRWRMSRFTVNGRDLVTPSRNWVCVPQQAQTTGLNQAPPDIFIGYNPMALNNSIANPITGPVVSAVNDIIMVVDDGEGTVDIPEYYEILNLGFNQQDIVPVGMDPLKFVYKTDQAGDLSKEDWIQQYNSRFVVGVQNAMRPGTPYHSATTRVAPIGGFPLTAGQTPSWFNQSGSADDQLQWHLYTPDYQLTYGVTYNAIGGLTLKGGKPDPEGLYLLPGAWGRNITELKVLGISVEYSAAATSILNIPAIQFSTADGSLGAATKNLSSIRTTSGGLANPNLPTVYNNTYHVGRNSWVYDRLSDGTPITVPGLINYQFLFTPMPNDYTRALG